ncbi:DUF2867 domain-containing protein [Nocardia sp. NPDC020380]|uniref:DUF2867 domain-containing protein n=1 Tax=Nocardia sp. NPDC020380 TaxID=3364309 RepID=UPI0037AAE752
MRLQSTAHTSRPWRIHELTDDFVVEDVWALPTPGGPGDFGKLVRYYTSGAGPSGPAVVRALFAIRWKLGAVLRLDRSADALGTRAQSLRDLLPDDLRSAPRGPDFAFFSSVYLLDDEWVAEFANRTVHGVMHVGWVSDGAEDYHGQMAVLVKPNGVLGKLYMAAIAPFRNWVVYPAVMRGIQRDWRARAGDPVVR